MYIYDVVIVRDGTVCGVRLIKNPEKPDPVLVNAYIKAIRQWTFESAKKDGNPTDCIMTITIRKDFR
ncbi:energy transducer TonB [bacterium]|nr:energy transducer TonB [candidate division CSSED10-310 bacterium]